MEVFQPLIVKQVREEEQRVLRIYASFNKSSHAVKLEFSSFDPDQTIKTKHATCTVEYGSSDKWLRQWARELHLVQDRIKALESLAVSGQANKITCGLAYRLFSSLVDYAPRYQRMEQVLLAGSTFEASATVSLKDRGGDDSAFVCNPYFIDALAHISGFVMNGNFTIDYQEAVYISHGWESMRFAKPLQPAGHYQTYVRMLPAEKTMVSGNVWILCDSEIVGLIQGLRFQRVPRTVLDLLLPPVGHKRGTLKTSTPRQVPIPIPEGQISPKTQTVTGSHYKSNRQNREVLDSLLEFVAEELGHQKGEISLHDKLYDLGLDSLMTLTLTGNLQERLGIKIPHSQLLACDTIGQLLDLIHPDKQANPIDTVSEEPSFYPSDSSSATDSVGVDTPTMELGNDSEHITELIKSIILDETGVMAEDLQPRADLSSLGLDSLMSLAILGRLRDASVELPMDFFLENHTMDAVFEAISKRVLPKALSYQQEAKFQAERNSPKLLPYNGPHCAKAILLQRRSNPLGDKHLFLFPDGSGSPSSYSVLEQIHPDFNIYGLVCPFLKAHADTAAGIKDIVRLYLSTIREHQPEGPYHVGGWSVGGVLAYEASKQLIEAGEELGCLILIDAPCPITVPPMSSILIEFLDSSGAFDGMHSNRQSPMLAEKKQELLNHFNFTVNCLGRYTPTPLLLSTGIRPPKTFIIWAQDGVHHNTEGSIPPASLDVTGSWILDKRTDFGPGGWESLLPVDNPILVVPGNHFTMMAADHVSAHKTFVADFITLT